MGYFSSEPGYVARIVNTLTPQGRFGLEQNRLLMDAERPYFEEQIDQLDTEQVHLASELVDDFTIGDDTGQRFGALWVNRAAETTPDTPPLIVINGFMGNLTGIDDKMRTYFLARAMPDRQILVVEQLSQGLSDKYDQQERIGLCKYGDASRVGDYMYRAIRDFVTTKMPDASSAVLHGDSFGSRIGLDVALADQKSEKDVLFNSLQLFELPGTRDRRFSIHGAYFFYEYLRSNNYRAPWVEVAKKNFADYLGPTNKPQPDFFHRDPGGAIRNFWHSILGHHTGRTVLATLIERGLPVTRIVGEASRIDNPTYAAEELRTLGGFVLGIADHASHDALGALSHARMRGRLIGSLTCYPLSPVGANPPRSFNLRQFSNNGEINPLESYDLV